MRDKLANGELHAAHVLYGLIYGLHLGIGGPKKDMAVLMTLNNNGQAITLSNGLKDKGAVDGASLAKVIAKKEKEYTFAQTFPTGTPRHVAVLLAGRPRHRPVQGREEHRRAAPRRWSPTCASATWTATAWANRGTSAPSSTRSASPR